MKFPFYVCEECCSPDVEVSAWIHLNTNEPIDGEGPASRPYCPACESDCRIDTLHRPADVARAEYFRRARRWCRAYNAAPYLRSES